MKWRYSRIARATIALAAISLGVAAHPAPKKGVPGDKVTFKKTVLDTQFRTEGAAVGDVNRDGKLDVLAGDLWYEAPNWTPHEIEPVQKFDGEHGYSNSFFTWAMDVNKDGWIDEIVIGFPGSKCVWRENPKGAPGPWKEHVVWASACNETPNFVDLLGNKKPVLVFPYDEKFMAWYEPMSDPNAEFKCHTVSTEKQPGTMTFSHGLGVGDVNGDGRADIITTEGWYEAPADRTASPWKFVKADLGPACANMAVYDVNGDGLPDVITSSAHERGLWWHEQKKGPNGPEFVKHEIDGSISEMHALQLVDINGDGLPDIVSGKRFWAHGPTGDIGAGEPAVLCWYEFKKNNGQPEWIKHVIDEDSGVGTELTVADINKDGLPDIIISNKKGVFLFTQERKK